MELIDMQSRQEEEDIKRLSSDIRYGKHSQPTTPPEYANSTNTGFPSSFSRPNRFSMSAINPGLSTPRGSRAGSQLASPPSTHSQANGFAAQSMPGSRRNSDEDGDDFNDDFTPESPVHIRK